ncbi:MAG: c-type cytochrome, methanol metabolism-related [Acidobacteria bacterium]|nr:MAG: c-type cytochrome, methanol metabolism-related [Acidobacteriota bacterium]
MRVFLLSLAICAGAFLSAKVQADGAGDPTAVKEETGKYYDKDGNPTYKIQPDGAVDWYTMSGYLRYNSMCIVCHGPDGAGSTYAPALTDSLKSLSYGEFLAIVAQGRKNVSAATDYVMPSFGNNKNVTCYLDNIYVYLRARSSGAVGRGRPEKHVPKPAAAAKAEDECMGP